VDISTWKIPKKIKLADEKFDQPGHIDILIGADLSTICFDLTEGHILVITLFHKRQFLAGHSQVVLQLPQHGMTLSIHFCSEKTKVWSTV